MGSEYVRLTNSEKIFGNRNMLHAQLEFLNSMRGFKKFRDLRSNEFILKVSLKNRIGELHALLSKFESFLPKTSFRVESKKLKGKKISPTLQDEIDVVKRKIDKLQIQNEETPKKAKFFYGYLADNHQHNVFHNRNNITTQVGRLHNKSSCSSLIFVSLIFFINSSISDNFSLTSPRALFAE